MHVYRLYTYSSARPTCLSPYPGNHPPSPPAPVNPDDYKIEDDRTIGFPADESTQLWGEEGGSCNNASLDRWINRSIFFFFLLYSFFFLLFRLGQGEWNLTWIKRWWTTIELSRRLDFARRWQSFAGQRVRTCKQPPRLFVYSIERLSLLSLSSLFYPFFFGSRTNSPRYKAWNVLVQGNYIRVR